MRSPAERSVNNNNAGAVVENNFTQNDSFRDSDDDSNKNMDFRRNSFSSDGSGKNAGGNSVGGKNRTFSKLMLSSGERKSILNKAFHGNSTTDRRESALSNNNKLLNAVDNNNIKEVRKVSMRAHENEISEKSDDEDDQDDLEHNNNGTRSHNKRQPNNNNNNSGSKGQQ